MTNLFVSVRVAEKQLYGQKFAVDKFTSRLYCGYDDCANVAKYTHVFTCKGMLPNSTKD